MINKILTTVVIVVVGIIIVVVITNAFTGPGSNQPPSGTPAFWRVSGSNVYYSGGNVGIGTASPGEKLEVDGDIKLTGSIVKTGTVANVVMVQTREQGTYSAPASGDGTEVTPLRLTITPKKTGNIIILEWVVSGEMQANVVYIVTRNGTRLADTTNASNNRWAGVSAQSYDNENGTTPENPVVKIIDMNSLDVATTYELRVRASAPEERTLYLNRTMVSAGGDYYEASLSTGIATEIWQ